MIESQLRIIKDTRQIGGQYNPQVSVVVPMYNVEIYVSECLCSLISAGSLVDLELIIVDDGSNDNSVDVILTLLKESAKRLQVLFVSQLNQGSSVARNVGISLCRGKYVCFLDSDDFIFPEGLKRLFEYAEEHGCDMVMARSKVFDSKSHKVLPFYDDWAWFILLENADHRVLDSGNLPPLCFCLEPNANYRLTNRRFYVDNHFHFPEGRIFEDLPVHLNMLAKVRKLGLINIPYYWYRVNRPGKVTNDKSERRFDIFPIVSEAIQITQQCQVSNEQGGASLYGIFRLVWWCGMMALPEHRNAFFNKAAELFKTEVPKSWADSYFKYYAPDIRHLVLGALFMHGKSSTLEELAFEKRNPIPVLVFLIRIGWMGVLAKLSFEYLGRIMSRVLNRKAAVIS